MFAVERAIFYKKKDASNPTLQKVAISMSTKFVKYWGCFGSVNKLIYVANVLDPRFKLQLLRKQHTIIETKADVIEYMVTEVKNCLNYLYGEYKGTSSMEHAQQSDLIIADVDKEDEDDILDQLERERAEKSLTEISNEVDSYFADPFESAKNSTFNLLEWWKVNAPRYPILSKIAKDIFAIPSSTVASENAFSLGRRVVDPFRASLTPRMVEALVCTSDWLRDEAFSFYKEPSGDEVEFYKDLEEIEANWQNIQMGPATSLQVAPVVPAITINSSQSSSTSINSSVNASNYGVQGRGRGNPTAKPRGDSVPRSRGRDTSLPRGRGTSLPRGRGTSMTRGRGSSLPRSQTRL
ncbi:unnamed protein product [Cuscuta europaea]|uniref:HAT C-terminal dimerisation domain-containing protein n=1 Tax=Cuscuta europaea TaxID=41803 RepID=A0A9P0ZUB6_CUSEU|nr:unnamed protein product [Cuscuta europaea]